MKGKFIKYLVFTVSVMLIAGRSGREASIHPRPLSNGPRHHFFGYYGINPWDQSGRFHLALETAFDDRKPESHDTARVGVIDKRTGSFIPYAETSAFNLQQGSMMHWIDAGHGEEFTYNAFVQDSLVSFAVNFKTGEKRKMDKAIAALSPNRQEAIGLDFERMSFCRPTVGYAHDRQGYKMVNIPDHDGLYSIDLRTGRSKLMLSVKEVIMQAGLVQSCIV